MAAVSGSVTMVVDGLLWRGWRVEAVLAVMAVTASATLDDTLAASPAALEAAVNTFDTSRRLWRLPSPHQPPP